MASLTHVLERMQKKEKPLWHLHRSSEIESVDELQFASGRWMKPIQHFPKPKTEERQKSRQTPSTAVIPTVAIHRGNHGTYEPARTTIEQNSRQQTTKQVVVRKLRIRQTESAETMARMKRFQRFKPAIVRHGGPIQWNGVIKTAIFEGHSRKSNLQHGDVMLQHESVVRRDGIQCKGVISCHSHSNLFVGFLYQPLGDGADIAQIVMPAHELQLTYGRRVNPIQHFPINQGSTVTSQGTNRRKKRSQ